VAEGEIENTSS